MKTRRIFSILICFAMITLLFGCALTQKRYLISYDILSEPKNLDPQTASDSASLTVINNIFEGLFYIDEFSVLQKGIAKSTVKSSDGLTYTIDIKEDVQWTNGDKVTASDFVFGLQRLLSPDTNSPAAPQFFSIKNGELVNQGELPPTSLGVTALSAEKLKIELEYENDNLEYLLSTTYAFPCNRTFFNQTKGKYGLQSDKVMSNGPFDISSWKHDEIIKLKKSESYYNAETIKPFGVNLHISAEKTTLERLLNESVSAALITGGEIGQFQKKGYNTEAIENATWGLYFNTKNENLADENIRKAISTCFNRELYQDKLREDLSVATAIIPHSIMLFHKNFRDYAGEVVTPAFDAKTGYEYYTAGLAALEKQELPALKLLINKDAKIDAAEYFSNPSQILQKELALFLNIDAVEQKEYDRRIREGEFDVALYKLSSADNSVNGIFSMFESHSQKNYSSYHNEEYDRLLGDVLSKIKQQDIIDGYMAVEKKIIDAGVFVPMFYTTDYFVSTTQTTGIIYNKRTGLISFKNALLK